MAENGCGITALATILVDIIKLYSEDLRQQYYPKLNYDILSKSYLIHLILKIQILL